MAIHRRHRDRALKDGLYAEMNDRIIRYALKAGTVAPDGPADDDRLGPAAQWRPSDAPVGDRG
ncbi:MAG: hypothetical protein WDN49_04955 [Acetobacteraceae bacterium]